MIDLMAWWRNFWYTDENFYALVAVTISYVATMPALLTFGFAHRYKSDPSHRLSFGMLFLLHTLNHLGLFFFIKLDHKLEILRYFGVLMTPFAIFILSYYCLCLLGIGYIQVTRTIHDRSPSPDP